MYYLVRLQIVIYQPKSQHGFENIGAKEQFGVREYKTFLLGLSAGTQRQ